MAKEPKSGKDKSGANGAPPNRRKGKAQGREWKSIDQLSDAHRDELRRMLVEGATFEDAEEALNEMGEGPIRPRAIERYYRRDLALQQDRIRHQIETARKLRAALADSNSDHGDLAEAVLITGLMGLNRSGRASSTQHAFRVQGQQENAELRREAFRLKIKKFELDRKVLKARLETEAAKRELMARKLEQLKAAVERGGHDRTIGPEIMRQIQEIYGLASTGEEQNQSGAETHAEN